MNKQYFITALLFVIISFLGGFCFAKFTIRHNTPFPNSYCYHKITKEDVVLQSSYNQFSGRLVYSNELSDDEDVVPNAIIAAKLGLLLLESVYGEHVYEDKPYNVALLDSVWVVETSLLPPHLENDSSGTNPDLDLQSLICGGIGHVEINKHNGRIYTMYHTK